MNPTHPRILPDRDKFRNHYLDEDVELTLSNGDILKIEKGYRFDGQSIPWLIKWMFKEKKNGLYPALVRDFLIDKSPWTRYNRKFQDNEYKRFSEMPEYFTTKFRVYWFPKGVRLYGWLRFDLWGDDRGVVK